MGLSVPIIGLAISLHLIAFVLAVGAERRRSTARVVPDEYDEKAYCVYGTDASTVYGLTAFGLLLISQSLVNGVTKCLCFGRGMMGGRSATCAVSFFVFSWWVTLIFFSLLSWFASICLFHLCLSTIPRVTFLAAEACLLAGSARNAYHTKYSATFHVEHLSCTTLRKGVFAAGASLILLSMMASTLYYWAHSKTDTGGWERHQNEGLGMTSSHLAENQHQQKASDFEKV